MHPVNPHPRRVTLLITVLCLGAFVAGDARATYDIGEKARLLGVGGRATRYAMILEGRCDQGCEIYLTELGKSATRLKPLKPRQRDSEEAEYTDAELVQLYLKSLPATLALDLRGAWEPVARMTKLPEHNYEGGPFLMPDDADLSVSDRRTQVPAKRLKNRLARAECAVKSPCSTCKTVSRTINGETFKITDCAARPGTCQAADTGKTIRCQYDAVGEVHQLSLALAPRPGVTQQLLSSKETFTFDGPSGHPFIDEDDTSAPPPLGEITAAAFLTSRNEIVAVGAMVQGNRSSNAAFTPLVLTARIVTGPPPAAPPARPACAAPPVIDSFKADERSATTAGGQGVAVFRLRSRNGTRAVVWPSYRTLPLNGEVKLPTAELDQIRPVFYFVSVHGRPGCAPARASAMVGYQVK